MTLASRPSALRAAGSIGPRRIPKNPTQLTSPRLSPISGDYVLPLRVTAHPEMVTGAACGRDGLSHAQQESVHGIGPLDPERVPGHLESARLLGVDVAQNRAADG